MIPVRAARRFVSALGARLEQVAPLVRQHLELPGWIASRLLNLGGERTPDREERFDLRNELVEGGGGEVAMLWRRTHYSASGPVSGIGVLRWEPSRCVLIDSIGRGGWLEVELVPTVEDRAVVMMSGRQWIRTGRLRWPLPRALVGTAKTREWEEPGGRLGLSLTLQHRLFGSYAGYEVVLAPGESP